MNYFSEKEFECKDSCGLNVMSPLLIEKLNKLREDCGFPFIVNSGCRCTENNLANGGKPDSDHLEKEDGFCHGVDIRCISSRDRYLIILHAPKYFNRIGIGKSFIHLGDWYQNPARVVWIY